MSDQHPHHLHTFDTDDQTSAFREGTLPPDRLQIIRLPLGLYREPEEKHGLGRIIAGALSALSAFILMVAFFIFLLSPVRLIEAIPPGFRLLALVTAVLAILLSVIWLIIAGLRQRAKDARRATYRSRQA